MRFSLAALSFAVLAACGPSVAAPGSLADVKAVTAPAEDTQVLAVLSYASWCGSCKVLDPKIETVRAANDFEGVEFFALDYSARDEAAYFADAETLGIDRSSGDVLSTVTKSMSEAEIVAAIDGALS